MHSSYFLHDRVSKYWSVEFSILANMGLNQASSFKKRFYHVKIKSLEVAGLQELGQQMGQLQRQAFRKTYGKIWDLAMIEVSVQAVASLTQYYDQLIRNRIGSQIDGLVWAYPCGYAPFE